MSYRLARKAGRCTNGFERDGGLFTHLAPESLYGRALCGTKPGLRGNGWADAHTDVLTCGACISILKARLRGYALASPITVSKTLVSTLEAMNKERTMGNAKKKATEQKQQPAAAPVPKKKVAAGAPGSVAARLGLERLPRLTKEACRERAKSLQDRIDAGEFDSDEELKGKATLWANYYRRKSGARTPRKAHAKKEAASTEAAE